MERSNKDEKAKVMRIALRCQVVHVGGWSQQHSRLLFQLFTGVHPVAFATGLTSSTIPKVLHLRVLHPLSRDLCVHDVNETRI